MEIAIDFDGTCVKHEYPNIGKDIGAIPVLKELVSKGHFLILFTMRGDEQLQEAINWFKDNDVSLYGIQYNPSQHTWTKSNKCYAKLYIDDAGLGIPLINDGEGRDYVDWNVVREILVNKKIL
jgi:hypothetical protein